MYIRKRLWNCNWSLVTLSMHSVPWSQPSAERGRLQVAWLAWYKDTGHRIYRCPKLHNMEPLKGFKVLFLQPGRVAWQQQGTTQRRLRWWLSPPRFPLLTGHLNTSLGERTQKPDNFPSTLFETRKNHSHLERTKSSSSDTLLSSWDQAAPQKAPAKEKYVKNLTLYCLKNLKKFLMDCRQRPLQLQAFALSPCNRSKG